MNAAAIREQFLNYFEEKGHQRVASSGLIPADDPTLMFSNAGMNQFKDLFLGHETRAYKRACSSQKCVRAGGKHNDLENVGFTARHHTFFEMLGNFSFGDYFKKDAISYAWEFLTERLGIPASKLYVSVFQDDDEAFALWRDHIGVPEERIFRFDEKENFWAMGDTGPCGPCSEIYFDYGPEVPGSEDPYQGIVEGSDRYVEIWNLVFMQFNRDEQGTLTPLPNPSIDTGMGLERVSSVLQNKTSNYDSDLFQAIIQPMAAFMNTSTGVEEKTDVALRVIADHLRASVFLMSDGVVPSNEGRGYVLRRIMRRAMKFGRQLGKTEPFLHELVPLVVRVMGDAYPELVREEPQVTTLIRVEEQSFDQTLNRSLPLFMRYLEQLKVKGETTLPGQIVFFLYATHGFPLDLMKDIARDEGMTLDEAGFQQCLQEDARQSAAHADFKAASIPETLQELAKTLTIHHDPYGPLTQSGTILALVQKESLVQALRAGETGQIVLDCTPFYAESGGQIGDLGIIQTPNGCFEVSHTEKVLDRLILHHGTVISGCVTLKDLATAKVDQPNRQAIRQNHTATHLLHQALKEVLGWHVKQAGSLVDAEKLRFDFNHFAPMSSEEWRLVEEKVNREILANTHLDTSICDLEEAKASGAMALFGEKYQSRVRVVTIGSYSKELCGGTHVQATGEIGPFVIASEKGLASGVRRIVAHTGAAALSWFQRQRGILSALQDQLKTSEDLLITSLIKLQEEKKSLQTQLEQAKLALAKGGQLLEHSATIGPWTILVKEVSGVEAGSLRQLADELLSRIKKGAVLIASDLGDKVQLVAKSNAISVGLNAGDWVKLTAPFVDGSGGGRPEMAMAGGKNAKGIPQALEQAHRWAQDRLSETSS